MNISRAIGVILWGIGVCLASHHAVAAAKADGSAPLVCVPLSVTECGADDECQRGAAASVNLPQFLRVDVTAMTIRAVEEGVGIAFRPPHRGEPHDPRRKHNASD